MNFATIDPGRETGVAVWSDSLIDYPYPCWSFQHVGTLRYMGARDYLDRLAAMIKNYRIEFAVVERYVNFGRRFVNAERMVTQQTLLCEAFEDIILIGKRQWDPANTRPEAQKALIADYGIELPRNEHERDAVHMGINIFRRLPLEHAEKTAHIMAAAHAEHKIKLVA